MGCVCCKPSKVDGRQNGPGNSQDPNHVLANVSTVSPQHVAPVTVTNKRPPPAVPPKKREW